MERPQDIARSQKQQNTAHVLVVGLGVFRMSAGKAFMKHPIAEYLSEWSHTHRVIWVAQEEGSALHINATTAADLEVHAFGRSWIRDTILAYRLFRQKPDLVVLAYPAILRLSAYLIVAWPRRPVVAVYVGNNFEPRSGWSWLKIKEFCREKVVRIACAKADIVFARGAMLRNQLSKLNANVVRTVPISMAGPSRRRTDTPTGEYTIMYVGKLEEGKGVGQLLEGFQQYREIMPDANVRLHVVGDGPLRNAVIDATAKEIGVRYLGYINDPDKLADLYAEANLVMVPSNAPEGVPRVIEEALTHGVSVIASRQAGIELEFGAQIAYFPNSAPTAEDILATLCIRDLYTASPTPVRFEIGGRAAAAQHRAILLMAQK